MVHGENEGDVAPLTLASDDVSESSAQHEYRASNAYMDLRYAQVCHCGELSVKRVNHCSPMG